MLRPPTQNSYLITWNFKQIYMWVLSFITHDTAVYKYVAGIKFKPKMYIFQKTTKLIIFYLLSSTTFK